MDLLELANSHSNRHPWELARQSIIHEFIRKQKQQQSINILDIGSGDAFLADGFTKAFKATAYCVDIEYTRPIINQLNTTYNNSNLHLLSDLEEVIEQTSHIDVVTLLDIIEHVPDDVALLQSIVQKDFVGSDTTFIITVPAFQSLFSEHDIMLKHYRRYNLRSLKASVSQSGLRFEKGGYFFTSLLLPRIVKRMSEKLKPQSSKIELKHLGNWEGSALKTQLINKTLRFDFALNRTLNALNIYPPGLSCYAICSKK